MKAKRVAAGLLACLMLLTMAGCGGDSSETEAAAQQEQDMGTAVETQTVTRTDLSNENMVSGQIIADTSVSVVPTIGGTVKSLPVKAGDTVQKGQLLFQIDTSQITSSYGALQESYSATQQMTNEAIQNAQDALPLAQSAVTTAQTNYNNTLALFNVGAASQVELDQARSQLDQANNQLSQAKSAVSQARASQKAQLAQIESSLDQIRTQAAAGTVTAPCSGLITAVNIVEGGMAGQTGTAVVIAEGGRTRISVQVSEELLSQLKVGDAAQVTVSAVSPTPFSASIASIAPEANAQTALYEVRLYTPADVTYPIGAFADVTFYTNQRPDAVTVPSDAILTDGTEQYVFVVQGDTAKKVTVQTGVVGDGVTEITEGLAGGETLVVKGQTYLTDGAAVRVVSGEDTP